MCVGFAGVLAGFAAFWNNDKWWVNGGYMVGLKKTIVITYYLYAQPLFLIYHSPSMEPPERFLRRFEKDNVTHAFFQIC